MAGALEVAGEADAAAFLRRGTLRRVTTFQELRKVSELLTQDEPKIDDELDRAYKQAGRDPARLTVVRRSTARSTTASRAAGYSRCSRRSARKRR